MIGIITTRPDPPALLAERARALGAQRRDLVSLVTSAAPRHVPGDGPRIAVLDFGVKENMIRALSRLGCDVHVLPAQTSAEQVLSIAPNGVLLSNGPGDPADIPYALDMIRGLLGKKPLFGICLGHQLLGMALGGRSYKLKFGHHGGNHPVKDLRQNRIYITSQNHNYALAGDPVPGLRITHINLNDQTVEGFVHTGLPVMGIQFHPEAAPGPLDAMGLFEDFLSML
jgi:carbamoyl-phosphate synthase small subunit